MSGTLLLATTIAFRGATLIDGTGAPPRENALLVIADGRVVSVGAATPKALAALPPGTKVVAAEGKWIVPGLIDAHVHAESDDDLKTMLSWGVTSVRLMAEDVAASQKIAADSRTRSDVPDVFPAAPIFTTKGGWWDQGEPPDANLDRFPATPEAARASVRKAKALGSAEIKVMLDDMAWSRAPKPPLPKVPPAVLAALIGEARAQGMRATVHAPDLDDAKAAIAAGATALAHSVIDPLDDATIAAMKARPVFYLTTLDIFEFLADTRDFVERVLSDPVALRRLPSDITTRYRAADYAQTYRERYPNYEFVRRRLPVLADNVRRLRAAGVPVAVGTDMWAFAGLGVSIELDCLVRADVPPLEALRAATQTAARSLGIDSDRGTLQPGKRADLLVLTADPLRDVKNVRAIEAIYKNGGAASP
ncbi:MAG TPA: amidohydrolase family protein [Thermoanaerobaculia bacterium]